VVGAQARTIRGALGAVLRGDELSIPARAAALGAAVLAGLAAPAGLASWVLTTVFQPDGPAHRPQPSWLNAAVKIGTPGSLGLALFCLGWALARNSRGKADSDLLLFATVGLLVAFVGCGVASVAS
jgi:hypothetical protein